MRRNAAGVSYGAETCSFKEQGPSFGEKFPPEAAVEQNAMLGVHLGAYPDSIRGPVETGLGAGK